MTAVLYTLEYPFQAKTYEAVHPHVDADAAYLPLRPDALDATVAVPQVDLHWGEVGYVDRQVREIDPDVVVYNHNFRHRAIDFQADYPLVHLRHGASVGRGTVRDDVREVFPLVDAALAPGMWWADQYRQTGPDLRVQTVGVPEADPLVAEDPPRERRVLYAPTNHRYGEGSLLNTAGHVLDVFDGSAYDLVFRPHLHDTRQAPAREVVRRCRERICDLPNVTFDDRWSPLPALRSADLLLSDYSGIVTEWLHTDRPLVQFENVVSAENSVPAFGYRTDSLDLETVDRLYDAGHEPAVAERRAAWLEKLGIPMDGRAGERAARVIESYVR